MSSLLGISSSVQATFTWPRAVCQDVDSNSTKRAFITRRPAPSTAALCANPMKAKMPRPSRVRTETGKNTARTRKGQRTHNKKKRNEKKPDKNEPLYTTTLLQHEANSGAATYVDFCTVPATGDHGMATCHSRFPWPCASPKHQPLRRRAQSTTNVGLARSQTQ